MYPIVRLLAGWAGAGPRLGLFEIHVSQHRIWPQDIDPWLDLNNGRTLTLYDIGRTVLFRRIGIVAAMRERRWGGTVAGSSVRYRRRVFLWDRIEMRTRLVGWDGRFFYVTQSMWRGGECTSHALLRIAVTGQGGVVPPAEVAAAIGANASPPLPAWICAWTEAEALRPWPPTAALGG